MLLDPNLETPLYDCVEILAQVYCIQSDLCVTPLTDAEETWFTDGSSFVHDGHRYVGVAVTIAHTVVWTEALSTGT